MLNPELEETVHIDKVIELMVTFIEVSIDMRIEIELKCKNE